MRMPICKGCNKEIIWIKTAGGAPMPCDPQEVAYYLGESAAAKTVVLPTGETVRCELAPSMFNQVAAGTGYEPHWATCPGAGNFKKRKAR